MKKYVKKGVAFIGMRHLFLYARYELILMGASP